MTLYKAWFETILAAFASLSQLSAPDTKNEYRNNMRTHNQCREHNTNITMKNAFLTYRLFTRINRRCYSPFFSSSFFQLNQKADRWWRCIQWKNTSTIQGTLSLLSPEEVKWSVRIEIWLKWKLNIVNMLQYSIYVDMKQQQESNLHWAYILHICWKYVKIEVFWQFFSSISVIQANRSTERFCTHMIDHENRKLRLCC